MISDFKSIHLLGKGGFGCIYTAMRKDGKQTYAMKVIEIKTLQKSEKKEALNEIRFLASFDHPNIIKYSGSFFENGKLYIVMEFASGGDIAKLIKKSSALKRFFDENRIWIYFLQILIGLNVLHQKSVIHRDIKTRNIFLCSNDRVCLGDLGCARFVRKPFLKSQAGTPYYMSPEIMEGKQYNFKTDVWSLGIVLYELMTLVPPFVGKDRAEIARKVIQGNYKPLPKFYSSQLKELISCFLQRDPTKRPSSEEILSFESIKERLVKSDVGIYDTVSIYPEIRYNDDLSTITLPDCRYGLMNNNTGSSLESFHIRHPSKSISISCDSRNEIKHSENTQNKVGNDRNLSVFRRLNQDDQNELKVEINEIIKYSNPATYATFSFKKTDNNNLDDRPILHTKRLANIKQKFYRQSGTRNILVPRVIFGKSHLRPSFSNSNLNEAKKQFKMGLKKHKNENKYKKFSKAVLKKKKLKEYVINTNINNIALKPSQNMSRNRKSMPSIQPSLCTSFNSSVILPKCQVNQDENQQNLCTSTGSIQIPQLPPSEEKINFKVIHKIIISDKTKKKSNRTIQKVVKKITNLSTKNQNNANNNISTDGNTINTNIINNNINTNIKTSTNINTSINIKSSTNINTRTRTRTNTNTNINVNTYNNTNTTENLISNINNYTSSRDSLQSNKYMNPFKRHLSDDNSAYLNSQSKDQTNNKISRCQGPNQKKSVKSTQISKFKPNNEKNNDKEHIYSPISDTVSRKR